MILPIFSRKKLKARTDCATIAKIKALHREQKIIAKLTPCTTLKEINAVFKREKVKSYQERSILLNKCMHAAQVRCECFKNEFSEKEEYAFDCAVFIDGTWRLQGDALEKILYEGCFEKKNRLRFVSLLTRWQKQKMKE